MVSNGNASAVGILEPVLGAGKADLIFPVPSGTSEVGRSGVVGGREDASSVDEVIAFVAGKTVSIISMGSAVIRDSDASTISIEDPVLGASQADLVIPIPGGASRVGGFHVVSG